MKHISISKLKTQNAKPQLKSGNLKRLKDLKFRFDI